MNFAAPATPARRLARTRGVAMAGRLVVLVALSSLCACSTPRSTQPANSRPFRFETDTFAFANELVWEYYYDADGDWKHRRNETEPDYTHRCFVVTRSARQFFQHAEFDASLPRVDEAMYRQRIEEVIARDPAQDNADDERVLIPGYANLRSFSADHGDLLKATCGGFWQSYFQRGHWRMIFPFSRAGREREAESLAAAVRNNRPPIVHVMTFPARRINHAVLLFEVRETAGEMEFSVYDPNHPEAPSVLTFDRATRTFHFPANDYWRGGRLQAYEVYRAWNY